MQARTLKILLAICLITLAVSATNAWAIQVGETAPGFTATDSNGKTHALKDFAGKYVVLEWINHECPFIRKHYETSNMQNLQKEMTDKGVVWLSINSSAPAKQGHLTGEEANKLTKEKGAYPSAVILDGDGKIGNLYGAKTTPHMFVIDPKGKLIYQGAIDDKDSVMKSSVKDARNYVRMAISESMENKAISTASTQPYGCSVKYAKN